MEKAVLMSIKPKWVEKIASGEKTIEVRKTRPSIDTPFKVYIYETKDKRYVNTGIYFGKAKGVFLHKCGYVIGEFICDEIIDVDLDSVGVFNRKTKVRMHQETCLSRKEAAKYLGWLCGYGWHIFNLKIYGKPKELSEFKRMNRTEENSPCAHTKWLYEPCKTCKECNLKRPPQSWCYVEEVEQ